MVFWIFSDKVTNSFVFFLFTPFPLTPFSIVSPALFATGLVPNLWTRLLIKDSEAEVLLLVGEEEVEVHLQVGVEVEEGVVHLAHYPLPVV